MLLHSRIPLDSTLKMEAISSTRLQAENRGLRAALGEEFPPQHLLFLESRGTPSCCYSGEGGFQGAKEFREAPSHTCSKPGGASPKSAHLQVLLSKRES